MKTKKILSRITAWTLTLAMIFALVPAMTFTVAAGTDLDTSKIKGETVPPNAAITVGDGNFTVTTVTPLPVELTDEQAVSTGETIFTHVDASDGIHVVHVTADKVETAGGLTDFLNSNINGFASIGQGAFETAYSNGPLEHGDFLIVFVDDSGNASPNADLIGIYAFEIEITSIICEDCGESICECVTQVTVIFDLNGGTRTGGGELTQTIAEGDSATAPTVSRSNYTFNGWNGAFTNVTENITVTAQWTYNAPYVPPYYPPYIPPSIDSTNDDTSETIETPGTPSTTPETPEVTLETLIADALAQAEMQDGADSTVTLDLSGIEGVTTAAVLSVETAQILAAEGIAVEIILPVGAITLNLDALGIIASAEVESFTIEAAVVPMSDLRGMQAAQVKGYETVVSIDVFVGDEKVDVPLTVSLPYNLKPNENPAAVTVWHLDDNGVLTNLNGVYDAETGMITFTINHQSYFVVGYDPVALWENKFSDIDADEWYFDAVAYANYHSMMNGYGNNIFAPSDTMTRAMFVTVLWNLEDNPTPNGGTSFTDVSADAWYHDAVIWASENSIASATGNNIFSPESAITRQEMAAILYSYANYKEYEISVNRAMPSHEDFEDTAWWARAAMRRLSEAGVINGDTGFRPGDTATRAEVAQIFRNFMRFVAN